jgi:hypothetical protein
MITTALDQTSFLYVDSDVPPGQTLRDWAREREQARREARRRERRARRGFGLLRPRLV